MLLESGSLVGPGWLEHLLAASGRENHSEVQWLEQELKNTAVKEDS